ncbi:MAG: hypothetical protein V1744_01035 [Candidatus Altiarchaeota archaeon]
MPRQKSRGINDDLDGLVGEMGGVIQQLEFIERKLGLPRDSCAAHELVVIPTEELKERMGNADDLMKRSRGRLRVGYRKPTKGDKEKGINPESWRWDILTVPPKTLEANVKTANIVKLVYSGPGVHENRSNFLVADPERVKLNLLFLNFEFKEGRWPFDIRDCGDLAAENPDKIQAVMHPIYRGRAHREDTTLDTVRTDLEKLTVEEAKEFLEKFPRHLKFELD